jgi:hypothetical protein
MNSKLALTAIAMIAAIMAFGVATPAMAAPNENANDKAKAGKITICHVEEDDPATEEDESSIDLITVSANSAHANPAKHPLDFAPFVLEDGSLTCEEPVEPEPVSEG